MIFFARELAKRSARPSRQSVNHEQYVAHAHLRADGLGYVFVCDAEYPARVAFSCMNRLYENPVPLQDVVVEWQDPRKADKLARVHDDLDETIAVVHRTIETVLARGEKLEDLVKSSEDLSAHSKLFYDKAASANRCCAIA